MIHTHIHRVEETIYRIQIYSMPVKAPKSALK